VPKIFLDTNLLVCTLDKNDAEKQKKARAVVKNVVEREIPVISTQVLQEFYSAATTKLKVDKILAKNILHGLGNMETVPIDLSLIEQGVDISILTQISFWDGLILAAAEQANCDMVFSEDLNAGQTIRGVRIVNPFKIDSLALK